MQPTPDRSSSGYAEDADFLAGVTAIGPVLEDLVIGEPEVAA